MAHSILFARLLRTLRTARLFASRGLSVSEGTERLDAARFDRRRALSLGLASAATAACATTPRTGTGAIASGQPRVIVVGAGLAGSVAAWRLQQAGLSVELYDAGTRVGGRAFTLHNQFPVKCELGGELIDTSHTAIRTVATELGCSLVDVHADLGRREQERYVMNGVRYTEAQILNLFRPVAGLIVRDLQRIGAGPVNARHHNPTAESLDALSTAAWMDRNGVRGPLRALLDVAFTSELGRELGEQSALGFLYTIGRDTEDFKLYGESDERFIVREGSDAIARRIATQLGNRVYPDHALVALRARDGGGYQLIFDRSGRTVTRDAERVVLAMPFNQLRRCALAVTLPPEKRRTIDELPYGTNAKVMIAVRNRPWHQANSSGTSFSNGGVFHESWDSSRGMGGDTAVMTSFTGGHLGVSVGESNPEAQGRRFADALDLVFEGTAEAFLNRAARMHWPTARWFEGSYACYGPGDWCRLGGTEAAAVGGLHFAGEHTSAVSPGYLNGAVESGERAAREVVTALGAVPRTATLPG